MTVAERHPPWVKINQQDYAVGPLLPVPVVD